MYKELVIAGVSSLWISTAVLADGTIPSQNSSSVVISTAVESSCFAKETARVLVWNQNNWWKPLGYKSGADWFAAALSFAVAAYSADVAFAVTTQNDGTASQLDFQANIQGATLVLAATTARNSASRFARNWREDWVYRPQNVGVTWVSRQAKAGRRAVGGSATGTGSSIVNEVSVTGTQISEFHDHITLNAGAWNTAASGSYAGLFNQAAAAMGRKITPGFAVAAGKALATALASAKLTADVDVHYTARDGLVVVDNTTVNIACDNGIDITVGGYAEPHQ